MRRALRAMVLLTALMTVAPVGTWAGTRAEDAEPGRSPGALAAEGLDKLFQALDLFIRSIPQYEPPEITEDGDIIIRRKRGPDADLPPEPVPPRRDGIRI